MGGGSSYVPAISYLTTKKHLSPCVGLTRVTEILLVFETSHPQPQHLSAEEKQDCY